MADMKISIGGSNAGGGVKRLKLMPDGTYAEVVVTAGSLLSDSTGEHTFDPDSLASAATYDPDGNQITLTYGPDKDGIYYRQTSTWQNGLWTGDSAWQVVTP